MQKIPYVSIVSSLMYAQVCTCSDITYMVGMLGRYLTQEWIIEEQLKGLCDIYRKKSFHACIAKI